MMPMPSKVKVKQHVEHENHVVDHLSPHTSYLYLAAAKILPFPRNRNVSRSIILYLSLAVGNVGQKDLSVGR